MIRFSIQLTSSKKNHFFRMEIRERIREAYQCESIDKTTKQEPKLRNISPQFKLQEKKGGIFKKRTKKNDISKKIIH